MNVSVDNIPGERANSSSRELNRNHRLHSGADKTSAVLGAITALVLISGVALRVHDDWSFLRDVHTLADPTAAAIMLLEIVPLAVATLLAVAIGVVAWMKWSNQLAGRAPIVTVFGATLVAGLIIALRGSSPAFLYGWLVVLLSASGVVSAIFQRDRQPR
jgi:hypothetical protein